MTNPDQLLRSPELILQKENTPEPRKTEPATPSQTERIQEGDWVKILDKHIASVFFNGKARVVLLLTGIVDLKGNPVIKPAPTASPKEKMKYDLQIAQGVREQTRAVLFGLTADQSQKREYEKTISVDQLKKTEGPKQEPQIKKTALQTTRTVPKKEGNFTFRLEEKPTREEDPDGLPRRRRRGDS